MRATVGAEAAVSLVRGDIIIGYGASILRAFDKRLLRRTTLLRGVGLPLRLVCGLNRFLSNFAGLVLRGSWVGRLLRLRSLSRLE